MVNVKVKLKAIGKAGPKLRVMVELNVKVKVEVTITAMVGVKVQIKDNLQIEGRQG